MVPFYMIKMLYIGISFLFKIQNKMALLLEKFRLCHILEFVVDTIIRNIEKHNLIVNNACCINMMNKNMWDTLILCLFSGRLSTRKSLQMAYEMNYFTQAHGIIGFTSRNSIFYRNASLFSVLRV